MEQSQANAVVREIARPQHEGHVVAVLEIHGREAWLASHVSEALGYEDSKQVVINMTNHLSDEVEEGTDFTVLRGEELALLKQVVPDLVSPQAPSLMVLFESGVHLVAMRARTDKARAFRRWLAEEVLPSIRRTGSFGRPLPSLSAEDVVRIATQAATTAAAAVVEQVLSRMGAAPSSARADLDINEDAVRRAREMRHLAVRHRRAGRTLYALRLEEQATTLLLGDLEAEAGEPSDDVGLDALRYVMAQVDTHPDRFHDADRSDRLPAAGAWWGRNDGVTLALVASWVDETLRAGGYEPAKVRRSWRARLWLHTQNSRGHACRIRIGGRPLYCLVFPLDILQHLGVL